MASSSQDRPSERRLAVSAGMEVLRRWTEDRHQFFQKQAVLSHMTKEEIDEAREARKTIILANSSHEQSEIARKLRREHTIHEFKVGGVNIKIAILKSDISDLGAIKRYDHQIRQDAYLAYRDEYDRIDLSSVQVLFAGLQSLERDFSFTMAFLKRGIDQLQRGIRRSNFLDYHEDMRRKLATREAITTAHEADVSALRAQIRAIRRSTGATACFYRYQKRKLEIKAIRASAFALRSRLVQYLEAYCINLNMLDRHGKALLRDAAFAEMLSFLKAEVQILRFPAEIRTNIYSQLLTFDKRTTVTTMKGHNEQLWNHPLFLVGDRLAAETKAHFYSLNDFGIINKTNFERELRVGILEPESLACIRTISLTITNFSHGIRCLTSKLPVLHGLKTLNIFIPWDKLLARKDNDRLAVEAFLLLLSRISTPNSKSSYFLKQKGAYIEAYRRYTQVATQISGLSPPYAFVLNEETQKATIQSLIDQAKQEQLHSKNEDTDSFDMSQASNSEIEAYCNTFPKRLRIISNKIGFTSLRPDLKINIYNTPLSVREQHLATKNIPQSVWDDVFTKRVLDVKDPEECRIEKEGKNGNGQVQGLHNNPTPVLMKEEEVRAKLDTTLEAIKAQEEAHLVKVRKQEGIEQIEEDLRDFLSILIRETEE